MHQLNKGDGFVLNVPAISQEQVNAYGALLGTNGPIHTDPVFARSTFLKGPVVQASLVTAPLHDAMSVLFGVDRWLRCGALDARFISYTRPGEATRVELLVTESTPYATKLSFEIKKSDGTAVVVGDASMETGK
ncbi:MaoC family dehydratase [Paraburkholderia agricolaris]|uniref:MaoC family dehydratase n=1 Tax=Paraburkholderia agricolaris TaxID=2152888 RepID=UPI001290AAE0|nr:MaoC family dehydratase [Paraburkholderia agricolaris]